MRRYDTVRENIQRYASWKEEHSPGTSLGVQCVVESVGDVLKFYQANHGLKVDYMVFRPRKAPGARRILGKLGRSSPPVLSGP